VTFTAVWAVITAFRPDSELLTAIDAVQHQLAGVVVVDDGSGQGFEAVLDAIAARDVTVVRLAENSGIAAALNAGLEYALAQGCDAAVTFDQDSMVEPGFIGALEQAHKAARERGHHPGPVVPEYFAGVSQVHSRGSDDTLFARHSIQSGMLIDRTVLLAVGLLREDLFIDLVDTEFELRCHARGFASIAAPGLTLAHSLGRRYERRAFGRRVSLPGIPPVVTLSTPFRYYYRVRNRIVINREFGRKFFGWTLRDTVLELLHFSSVLTLARPRGAMWSLYRAAWRDARRGKMGRMPDGLQQLAATITWSAPPAD